MWNLVLVHLVILLVLAQDLGLRQTYHRLRIVLDAREGTPMSREAQVESRFGPVGDSVSVVARWVLVCTKCTIGSENRFGHTRWYS
jgi:hypothetical protein